MTENLMLNEIKEITLNEKRNTVEQEITQLIEEYSEKINVAWMLNYDPDSSDGDGDGGGDGK